MKVLLKKIKWSSQILIVLLLLSIVGSSQVIEKVFAEDSEGIQKTANEEPIARTGGAQRIDVNNLVWTPVSAENPLGGADDFNAFLFDSFVDFHETGGPVAAGRFENVNIVTFQENLVGGINQFYDYTIPKFNVGLIAENGIIGLDTKVHNGDTAVNEEQYFNLTENSGGNDFVRQAQIRQFMSQAKSDLLALNDRIWNLPTNGKLGTDNWNRMVLTADKEMNVFEVNLTDNTDLDITDTKPGSTIVIKLKGNQINLKSMSVNGTMINYENINQIANRVLWIFDPSEPLVTFQQSNVTGSVLAPKTNIRFTGGYSAINGTLIANSLNGEKSSSELHYIGHYIGKLSNVPEVPEEPEKPDTSDSTVESSSIETDSTITDSTTSDPESSTTETSTEPSNTDPTTDESETSSSETDSTTTDLTTSETESSTTDTTIESGTTETTTDKPVTNPSESNPILDSTTSGSESSLEESTSSTADSSESKPIVKPEEPKKPNTLPQTGEGNGWVEKVLSMIGIGTILLAGGLYFRLQRKS